MQATKPEKSLALSFAAVAKLFKAQWSRHVAHRRTMKHHAESKFRKSVSQFHGLDDRPELAIEDAVFGKKRSLARRAPAPEVGKIEHLPILEIAIGKKEAANICDVMHQRRNRKRRRPRRVSQDSYVLFGMLLVCFKMLFEQVTVGDVVIITKKQNSAAGRQDTCILCRRYA